MSHSVRVRLAPSPTGNLHVGTARTALFNYLFAKHFNGTFILRVEDTDKERSEARYTQNIFDGLKALGLQWDEGPDVGGDYAPYQQSERESLYQQYAYALLEKGLAYWDYTSPDELETLREEATAQKKPFIYRNDLSPDAQAAKAVSGMKPSLRFRIPRDLDSITVHDLVRGDVEFDTSLIGDLVILKSDGGAAYNFACVVDDYLMKITHVLRGEDHLPNTPKQLLLYQALGWEPPAFAHLGMILAPDRSKLSKRHGATAVDTFMKEDGYLPEAFVNFLALLGWSTPNEEEIMSLERLCELFTIERVGHSGAIFDREKLNWMNGQYIRRLSEAELLERLKPFLGDYDLSRYTRAQLENMVAITKEPLVKLSDVQHDWAYFFGDDVQRDENLVQEVLHNETAQDLLKLMLEQWLPHLQVDSLESAQAGIKHLTKELGKEHKTKTVMWTLRCALTGRVQGADLPSTLMLLGKERIALRLKSALASVHV